MFENTEHFKDYKYIGIELTEEYLPISKARIEWAINPINLTHYIDDDTNEDSGVSITTNNLWE